MLPGAEVGACEDIVLQKIPTGGAPKAPVLDSFSAVAGMGCSCKKNSFLTFVPKFARQNGELLLPPCLSANAETFQGTCAWWNWRTLNLPASKDVPPSPSSDCSSLQ